MQVLTAMIITVVWVVTAILQVIALLTIFMRFPLTSNVGKKS